MSGSPPPPELRGRGRYRDERPRHWDALQTLGSRDEDLCRLPCFGARPAVGVLVHEEAGVHLRPVASQGDPGADTLITSGSVTESNTRISTK